jgi:hypothetical protein
MARGQWTELESTWPDTTAVTALGDRLYAVCQGRLYAIDEDGDFDQVGSDTWSTRFLLPSGAKLIAIEQNGSMYTIDPASGAYDPLGEDWDNVAGAAAITGSPHVVDNDILYKVSQQDGSFVALDAGWTDLSFLVSLGAADSLVAIRGLAGSAYMISADGTWRELSITWPGARAAGGGDGKAYIVENSALYELDPIRDSAAEVPTQTSWDTVHLVSMGRALYAFEAGGGLYKISLV